MLGKYWHELEVDYFFYLVEKVYLDLNSDIGGMSEYHVVEVREYLRFILSGEESSETVKYPHFPDDPRQMSKEEKMVIDLQATNDLQLKQKKLEELTKYRKWKAEEKKRRLTS